MNPRNSASSDAKDFNENGTPLCPLDGAPFLFHSKSGGKNRSMRLKYICPKTRILKTDKGTTRRCLCETPCSISKYGKSVYVYPEKNLRLYPGLSRDSLEFACLLTAVPPLCVIKIFLANLRPSFVIVFSAPSSVQNKKTTPHTQQTKANGCLSVM